MGARAVGQTERQASTGDSMADDRLYAVISAVAEYLKRSSLRHQAIPPSAPEKVGFRFPPLQR